MKNMENIFEPRKSISERYSLGNITKSRNMSVKKFKAELAKQLKMKQDIIDKQLSIIKIKIYEDKIIRRKHR